MKRAAAGTYPTYQVAKRQMTKGKGPKSRKSSKATSTYQKLNRRGVASKDTGFVDLAAANYAMDTTGTITLIATVPSGTSVNTRVGKKIAWKSLQLRGSVVAGTTTTVTKGLILVVYDKRPTGALPAITDVLNTISSNAFNNDANSGRFKIVRRLEYSVCGNSGTAGQQTDSSHYALDEFIDLKAMLCVFKASATGGIGDIEEGALYLVTAGNTVAGTAASSVSLGARTRFVDLH